MIERLCDVMEKSGVGERWYVKMLVMLSGCLCEEHYGARWLMIRWYGWYESYRSPQRHEDGIADRFVRIPRCEHCEGPCGQIDRYDGDACVAKEEKTVSDANGEMS